MANRTRRTTGRVDVDGVRIVETSGPRREVWPFVLAAALVGIAVFVVVRPASRTRTVERPEPPAGAVAVRAGAKPGAAPAPGKPPPQRPAARVPVADTESGAAAVAQPPHDERATSAAAEGDPPTGIAVFPPPDTNPPKAGVIVPEDFALPPGYVRHYQVTDDGRQLAPILMFHPDYRPVGERGEPIVLPEDRVVPLDMVPPGMPVRMLEVPQAPVPMIEFPEEQGGQEATR